jgi:hypothetical protein
MFCIGFIRATLIKARSCPVLPGLVWRFCRFVFEVRPLFLILGGLADFLARFAVKALRPPLRAVWKPEGPKICIQGGPESLQGNRPNLQAYKKMAHLTIIGPPKSGYLLERC